MGFRVAVLIKQVPRFEARALDGDGRLVREGLELELNPYCRRAIAMGVQLAAHRRGTCTVFTLGPPSAEDAVREAIAWGADDGVLVSDPAFAGSDTIATATALAAAVARADFDMVLTGRNSVDADTGQVGPQIAELLGLPFLGGVRELTLEGAVAFATCELDDGAQRAHVVLPAVVSCAERLCEPAKVPAAGRMAVPAERIRRLDARDLGPGPWGTAASLTVVGEVRSLVVERARLVLSGTASEQVARAVAFLTERGALTAGRTDTVHDDTRCIPEPVERAARTIVVVVPPGRAQLARELLGTAAQLAAEIRACVVAVTDDTSPATRDLSAWGAEECLRFAGTAVEEDLAAALAGWCAHREPWAILLPSTMWGREIGARLSVRLRAGLTGDAVDLTVDDQRLLAWKPAFGGQLVAAVRSTSSLQMVTVRPGALACMRPRTTRDLATSTLCIRRRERVWKAEPAVDDDSDALARAHTVVGVGHGIDPADYPALDPLCTALGAELAATRKVTDAGWLPRSRQIGITGRAIAPALYVAIAVSGKFNHSVGVRGAGTIFAVNEDPKAPIFEVADVGIVADWHDVVPVLARELAKPAVAAR